MSLKLREFIKKIRACKTADEERSLVNKESAEIRNLSKEQGEHFRVRSLSKCICMSLLGYPTEFVHMTCLELLASGKFTEKRLAYLGVCILLDERSEVLLLTSHTIKRDLENPNQFIVAAALNAIGEIATPDMCRDTSGEVLKCLGSTNPYIKKKACLALCKIIRNCPEVIDTVADKLKLIFEDKNHGVLLSGSALICQIFKSDKVYIKKYSKYVHHLLKFLKTLSTTNYAPEYDINGVTDPFLQVKLLEVLGLFGTIFEEENEEMSTLLGSISTNTEGQKNTGNAVLYELVRTIFIINSSSGLKTLGSSILGKFLEHKDNNYKYIALNSLYDISKIDINIVQKHKNTILEFLKDNDISIKRRSLDLIYLIVNQSNIKQIISESLNFLNTRENIEFLEELIQKIYESLEKYSPSLKWEIDTLLKMLCLGEDKVPDQIISKIINTIIEAKALHQYSMFRFFIAMKSNIEQESLIKVGIYLLGELGRLIIDSSAIVEENESITIREEDIIMLLTDIKSKYSKEKVKTFMVNCYFKLCNKVSVQSQEKLKELLIEETKSFFCEVQERATEYIVFLRNADQNLKSQINENIPNHQNTNPDACKKEIIVEEFENENEKNLYQGLINNNGIYESKPINPHPEIAIDTGVKQNNILDDINNIFQIPSIQNTNVSSGFDFGEVNLISSFPISNNDQPFNLINMTTQTQNNQSKEPQPQLQPQSNSANLSDQLGQLYQNTPSSSNPTMQIPDFSSFTSLNSNNANANVPNDQFPINQSASSNLFGEMKEVFKNNEATVYSMLQMEGNSPNHLTGAFLISNNQSKILENVKLNFSVKKNSTLKVISTSSNQLESNASLGIKKEVSIQNNDPSKPIVLKISLSYYLEKEEKSTSFVVTI